MADRGRQGGAPHRRRRARQAAPEGDDHDEPRVAARDTRSVPEPEYARSVMVPNTNQDPSLMTEMEEDRLNKKDLKKSGRICRRELRSFEMPTNLARERQELLSIYKGICTNVNTNVMLRRRYLKLALELEDDELSKSKDALQLQSRIKDSLKEIQQLEAQVKELNGPVYDLPDVLVSELKLKEKKKRKSKK